MRVRQMEGRKNGDKRRVNRTSWIYGFEVPTRAIYVLCDERTLQPTGLLTSSVEKKRKKKRKRSVETSTLKKGNSTREKKKEQNCSQDFLVIFKQYSLNLSNGNAENYAEILKNFSSQLLRFSEITVKRPVLVTSSLIKLLAFFSSFIFPFCFLFLKQLEMICHWRLNLSERTECRRITQGARSGEG